jgi:predicted RND superfamily exporter protein
MSPRAALGRIFLRIRPFRTIPLRAPRFTLAAILIVTVALGYFARSLRVDSSVENLLPADDPERVYYNEVRETFGSEEATLIALFTDNVFVPQTLAEIHRLSTEIAAIEGVREVISLTTVKGVEIGDMGVRVGKLMRELPSTPAEADAFKARVLADPVYVGNLVSKDATTAGILVLYDIMSDAEFRRRGIEDRVSAIVATGSGAGEFAMTGLQTLKILGTEMMERNLVRYLPLSVLVVAAVLLWAFRTARGVVLPLTAMTAAGLWTAGFMVLTGGSLSMGTLVLPPLLVAIAIAYAIPLLSRYEEGLQGTGAARAAAIRGAVEALRLPLAIAAFATVLGFAALAFNSIRSIRDLGLYAAFGVAATYFVTLGIIPAALTLLPQQVAGSERHPLITAALDRLSRWAAAHRRTVLTAVAVVSFVAVWGATKIRVGTDYLSFFNPGSAVRVDGSRIAAKLGGTQPLYVVVDGEGPQALERLETLAALRDLQDFVNQQPGVESSLSLVDYVAVAQRALNPDARTRLPATQADLSQLLLFVTPADIKPVATADLSRANIIVRTRLSGDLDVGAFAEAVESYGRSRFGRDDAVRVTGVVALLNRSADALVHGHVAGLGQMLLVLFVLMSMLFLSVRAGLLSLVPIIVPIVLLFGTMGWGGMSLNISTCMIATIVIGITVANTIHYLSTLNTEIHRGDSEDAALQRVARSAGTPIVFATLALAAGFAILCLSSFPPIRSFGFLAGVTMVNAMLADVLITPALSTTTRLITLWDLLYVKLGPQPHLEIPLFRGLRPFQARLVVLMSRLAAAAPGSLLTRRGELKQELYILLSGCVDVRRREGERVIRQLGRGDVIGEMGLVRERPRSADLTVKDPTEYLVLDALAVSRLRRRYPRIAAILLLNLTRILSDRLENTTDQLATAGGEHSGRAAAGS